MSPRPSRPLASAILLAALLSAAPAFLPLPLHAQAAAPAATAASTAESRLSAVTVYPDRAVVRREARVSAPAGVSEWTFAGLPAGLLDESVQVSARGEVAASLLDIATRTVFVTGQPDARVKTLEDRLAELRREEAALNDRRALLDSQRGLVGAIEKAYTTPVAGHAGGTPPARPGLEDFAKLLAFSSEQRSRLDEQTRALALEQTALAEKIAAAENQLRELRGKQPGRRATKVVTVRLSTGAAGALDLRLSYALPGASWTPAYDARLRSAERQVQLDAFGLVRNATGEDWNGVELTLSTARPGLGGSAPEIAPWFVDAVRPLPRPAPSATVIGQQGMLNPAERSAFSNNLRMLSAEAGSFSAVADAAPAQAMEASFAQAAVEAAATSASFRIATPVNVPSDNSPQRVPLGSAAFAADLQYQATPKQQETAYLAAYVRNTSELPFLAGAMNVFLDDTFVAGSRLGTTMPGEKFSLSLGADEGISIKRKVVSRFTEDTGLTSRGRRTTYDILVTVTNNKRSAERIVLKDAVPVARDEKITVRLLAPSERELLKPEEATAQPPRPGIAREADGKMTWRFDLRPGERRELTLRFSIEHPADLIVTGIE
jgi:uncharacterized protein (TIGR02231 family)